MSNSPSVKRAPSKSLESLPDGVIEHWDEHYKRPFWVFTKEDPPRSTWEKPVYAPPPYAPPPSSPYANSRTSSMDATYQHSNDHSPLVPSFRQSSVLADSYYSGESGYQRTAFRPNPSFYNSDMMGMPTNNGTYYSGNSNLGKMSGLNQTLAPSPTFTPTPTKKKHHLSPLLAGGVGLLAGSLIGDALGEVGGFDNGFSAAGSFMDW